VASKLQNFEAEGSNMNKNFCATLAVLLFQFSSYAGDFFLTQDNLWFDQADKTQVHAVIEVKDLKHAEVDLVMRTYLPPSVYRKMKLEIVSVTPAIIRVQIQQMNHAELLLVKGVMPQLVRFGGHSLSPEIPLAVRVTDLKGHDDFLANVSGLPQKTIKQLDAAVEKGQRSGEPVVVRYYLDDREKTNPQDYEHLMKYHGDAVVTHIPANTFGQMPLYVPGKSVVFHARSFHGKTILGQINPGLPNSSIAQALTANKYIEALFWQQYAPGALPETHLLSLMGLDLSNVSQLVADLNRRFPEGWVMKGVNESSSNFSIITDKTDLVAEIQAYRNSDFEKVRAMTLKKMAGYDEDNIYEALQEHPNYFGWRASLYLKNPQNVIVQRKVAIDREFRVESIGGRILKGATIDRHNWLLKLKGLPYEVSSADLIERIEQYTQSVVDKLPPDLKEMDFAFDIALLKDGKFIAIESNAGSECGFLQNQDTSVAALNELLRKYPEMKSSGMVKARGMSGENQMRYLRERFKLWNIDPAVHYPSYRFADSEVQTGFSASPVKPLFQLNSMGSAGPKGLMCREILATH
jgi:hypothetical protein